MSERGTKSRRIPAARAGVVAAALCLLLLLASVALAGKIPSLASTSQYKAFTEYVKKLDGLVGQPVSAAQKGTYEAELTAKEKAAAHKANALFSRSSEKALGKADAKAKEQTEAVRRTEEGELEALAAEAGEKLDRASASYHAKLERLVQGHRKFEARTHEKIDALRARKAQAAEAAQKDALQERITALIGQITAKRQEEGAKRGQLKSGYQEQKAEIQAAAAKHETEIGEAAEAQIAKIAMHWKGAYNEKKASLNAKREAQLGYLNAKLEKGRADIATMPAAG